MSEKMPEKAKAVLLDVSIVGTLIWFYYKGYPLTAILISGFVLLIIVNGVMYLKHRNPR